FEQELGKSGDTGERVVQFVRDASDELPDSGEFFGSSEVVSDLLLLGEISDAYHEADDVVISVANVAQRDCRREFRSILSPVYVLTSPERLVELKRRNGLPPGVQRRRHDEIVDGKSGDLTGIVAVFVDRGGVGVLHLCIHPEYEHGLVHRRQRGGECALTGVGPLLLFAQYQHVDREGDGGSETEQRVDDGS